MLFFCFKPFQIYRRKILEEKYVIIPLKKSNETFCISLISKPLKEIFDIEIENDSYITIYVLQIVMLHGTNIVRIGVTKRAFPRRSSNTE